MNRRKCRNIPYSLFGALFSNFHRSAHNKKINKQLEEAEGGGEQLSPDMNGKVFREPQKWNERLLNQPIVRWFRSVIFIIHYILDSPAVALVAKRGVVFIGCI